MISIFHGRYELFYFEEIHDLFWFNDLFCFNDNHLIYVYYIDIILIFRYNWRFITFIKIFSLDNLCSHIFHFLPLIIDVALGFGSTARALIQAHGVHYDCGCIISQNGDLLQFLHRTNYCPLNVPAVYVAYFSTFGALVSFRMFLCSFDIIFY